MKKFTFSLFLLVITIVGCTKDSTLIFTTESATSKQHKLCDNEPCPDVDISYLIAEKHPLSKTINKAINTTLCKSLLINDEDQKIPQTLDDAISRFILDYQRDKKEFPDMSSVYSADISMPEPYQTETLISIEIKQYMFTGGAHGYGNTQFLNFNAETGALLSNKELFTDQNEFKKIAEKYFREQQNIDASASINAPGFWFENETFALPQTIGFIENSMVLIYNPYEIASYAQGAIEVKIPLSEIENLLAK